VQKLWAPTGEMDVTVCLKGRTNIGSAPVCTFSHIEPGKFYLIFSHFQDGQYRAIADYRFVSLGTNFSMNQMVGRTLDEKVQLLLKDGLKTLEQQGAGDAEQKKRLEEGCKGKFVHEADVIQELMRQASNGSPRFER
jgi:hypothetical protein